VTGTAGARFRISEPVPVALVTDTFLPIGPAEYFTCTPGQAIAVISNDASVTGFLVVTEIV